MADHEQQCSQFDTKGFCKNDAVWVAQKWNKTGIYYDFCAMHNHMDKTGMPLKCWRCGDKGERR